jgi:hypothetical protein
MTGPGKRSNRIRNLRNSTGKWPGTKPNCWSGWTRGIRNQRGIGRKTEESEIWQIEFLQPDLELKLAFELNFRSEISDFECPLKIVDIRYRKRNCGSQILDLKSEISDLRSRNEEFGTAGRNLNCQFRNLKSEISNLRTKDQRSKKD